MSPEEFKKLCEDLEHFETPVWTADAILTKETMTGRVIDPCCGTGILGEAARRAGYQDRISLDIHDWGYKDAWDVRDFLSLRPGDLGKETTLSTVFMNPPFSLAKEFVEKSFELGARKILCFQRFAWWESSDRRAFWDRLPPSRVYICGERATCWRHDLPKNDKGHRFDPETGKKLAGSPTAHAWFIFEAGYKGGTLLDRLYKS